MSITEVVESSSCGEPGSSGERRATHQILEDAQRATSRDRPSRAYVIIGCIFLLLTTISLAIVVGVVQHQQANAVEDVDASRSTSDKAKRLRMGSVEPKFQIKMIYMTDMTEEQISYFEESKEAWSKVLAKGFGRKILVPAGTILCNQKPLKESILITDMAILVSLTPIDGRGGILGQAGPCAYDKQGRIRVSLMRFDAEDIGNHFRNTVRHEMGHVFGLGSLWEERKLISSAKNSDSVLAYTGTHGNKGHAEIGGEGGFALVETEGGQGTARSHWKEDIYPNEVMTGYLNKDAFQPISKLTVRALEDLGYEVDISKADDFFIGGASTTSNVLNDTPCHRRRNLRAIPEDEEKIPLMNDIYTGPILQLEED